MKSAAELGVKFDIPREYSYEVSNAKVNDYIENYELAVGRDKFKGRLLLDAMEQQKVECLALEKSDPFFRAILAQ